MKKFVFKFIYLILMKLSVWARDQAGITIEQHQEALKATGKIKDASDKIEDTPVDADERDDDDIFNNKD